MFCYDAKLVVPFLTEATDERFAEELIKADATLFAEVDGILTDVPAMIVEACQGTQLFLANRVEVATDGLLLQEATL